MARIAETPAILSLIAVRKMFGPHAAVDSIDLSIAKPGKAKLK